MGAIKEYYHEEILKGQNRSMTWIEAVSKIVDTLPNSFTLQDVYRHKGTLARTHRDNKNVEAKIRQTLQVLRDKGKIVFTSKANYKKS